MGIRELIIESVIDTLETLEEKSWTDFADLLEELKLNKPTWKGDIIALPDKELLSAYEEVCKAVWELSQ